MKKKRIKMLIMHHGKSMVPGCSPQGPWTTETEVLCFAISMSKGPKLGPQNMHNQLTNEEEALLQSFFQKVT